MKRRAKNKQAGNLKASLGQTKAGAILRRSRMSLGLTLREVQKKTGLYICNISHIENGHIMPQLTTAITLCNLYGIDLEQVAAAVMEDEL